VSSPTSSRRIRRAPRRLAAGPRAALASALLVAFSLLAGPARADGLIFTVNTAQDLPDLLVGDGLADADPAPGLQTSLRAAIMEANADAGADTIVIPDGVWKLTRKGLGDADVGDLDVRQDLTIIGTPANPQTGEAGTILDGKKLKDRIFDVAQNRSLLLQGLTLRHGKAPDKEDGGLLRTQGALTLEQVIVSGGKSSQRGGAVAVLPGLQGSPSLTLTDVLIEKSSALEDGGGLWVKDGQLTAMRTTWQSCKSSKGHGGGLALEGGLATLTNVTFSGNAAKLDGGAAALSGSGVLSALNATLADNVCKLTSGLSSDPGTLTEPESNTVLLCNTLLDNKGQRNFGPVGVPISLGGNVDAGSSCQFSGSDLSETDPRLLKLKNWGGFTPTRALADDSPAIDRATFSAPLTDQRGVLRVDIPDVGQMTSADCGAYEFTAQP
jgi:hypothetical protein